MRKKTNILFILTDDHGAWALGCAGNREVKTPNLDRIAREGVRLDNCFCVSPVCSPARTSLFTGKIPSQHGVHDWLAKGHLDEAVLSKELRDAFQQPEPSWEYASVAPWPPLPLGKPPPSGEHAAALAGGKTRPGFCLQHCRVSRD